MTMTSTGREHTIRCAHCKGSHQTVAQVRLCQHRHANTPAPQPTKNTTWVPQHKSWLDVERETRQERAAYQAKMARDAALQAPAPAAPAETPLSTTQPVPPVPAGRYAVYVEDTLKFFKVDTPTEGKWKGYTFVSVQASDELYPVRNRQAREEILRLIALDPTKAMQRYGQEIGSCGRCNRTLTDETSRQRGIGPDCWDKMTGQ